MLSNHLSEPFLRNGQTLVHSVKVDPKAWFSTERTFLHWLNAAVLLSTTALAGASAGLGYSMSLVALAFSVYSFYIYKQRVKAMERGCTETDLHFAEVRGPFVLTVLLTCVLLYTAMQQLEVMVQGEVGE